MKNKQSTIGKPIPAEINPNGVLIWDINLLRRIANDLNRSLGLDPPIPVLPTQKQTDQTMKQLQQDIIEAVKLTNL